MIAQREQQVDLRLRRGGHRSVEDLVEEDFAGRAVVVKALDVAVGLEGQHLLN